MAIDLHIHSVYSDGTHTPSELVRMAIGRGLQAISVTDHDTMDGTQEALEAGGKYGIDVLPGLELSVVQNSTYLHILGYGMDNDEPGLSASLSRLQNARNERNLEIISKVQKLGIAITVEVSKIGQTGRPHIAKAMMAHGAVKDVAEAFDKFLKKGACAYVPRFVYTAEEAIGFIRQAGGLAVFAHPIQIDPRLELFRTLLPELVDFGLAGVELYYPTQSSGCRRKIRQIVDKYGLLYTGGSDYHGDIRPGSHLAGGKNVTVPRQLIDSLWKKLAQMKKS